MKKKRPTYTKWEDIEKEWMKNPNHVRAYEKLQPEFAVIQAMIDARVKKNLTQKALAKKMKTGQAVVSRLESGKAKPSIALLQRLADAIGAKLEIRFIPR
ncbi:MAG: hypothetical protein A2868_00165 [Candidatus Levybacteria bacterium RIFCSPHIGHO2_01_FULL_40_15b]|nr:MAG: hypothetical protein A2868_00165 [Candidatus Levybacteria bacterium RIFCSPHIGHO2_01_FULL_40_15b]